MKKIIIFLLSLTMAVFMCSCGGSTSSEVDSLEALSEAANGALIQPADVDIADEQFILYDGDAPAAEYKFTVDGISCTLYFANAGTDNEICTVDRDSIFTDLESEDYYVENDNLKAERWFTVDGQYIFVADDSGEMDWNQYYAIQSQFSGMKPLNWNSEVAFEDYQALCGTYSDKDNNMASIAIRQDHLAFYAYLRDADMNTVAYEMDAYLDGDTLKYDKETISKITYDQEAGQSNEESLGEGGAGTVKVDGKKLIFDNPGSKELKGLVLTLVETNY